MKKTDWRPVLTGEAAREAWQAIEAIAEALPQTATWNPANETPGLTEEQTLAWRSSLASGAAGEALFFTYLALHHEREGEEEKARGYSDRALTLLDRAFEGVARVPMSESLYAGFPGVAWVAAHLNGRLFSEEGEDGNAEVDAALLPSLAYSPWRGEFDLMHGLVGLGVYALERLPAASGRECLAAVVERLAELAQAEPEGITWFSRPESLPSYQAEAFPQGLYNLGASHGSPGVVAFLGAAIDAGVAADQAKALLAQAFPWLLARRHSGKSFCFTHFHYPGSESWGSRLAWCYGDPGVAGALWVAARGAGEPAWQEAALEVGLTAAARGEETAGIRDAGLCHGAGGVGHVFQRFFQATGDVRFGEAARFWLERALTFREPGTGVGGFRSWASDVDSVQDWRNDPGFLEGSAGVGLALLAGVSPVDPEWDRAFLLSLR